MNRFGRRNLVSTIISVLIIVGVLIGYLIIRNRDSKGQKVYLNDTIIKKEYKLTFYTESNEINGKDYYCVFVYITNNLTETQKFTFSNPYFKTDKNLKVTFGKLTDNGFEIAPGETEYYMLACPYEDMNDVKKCILHFKLNRYYFNLHTCLSSYENN